MLYFSIELFVDALVLALHCKTGEVVLLLEQILEIYDQETKDSTYMENDLFNFYALLIREVLNRDITITDKSEVEEFLLKFKSSPILAKDPEFYTTLKKIFTDENELSDSKKKYLVRKMKNNLLWYNNTKNVKKMFGKLANTNANLSPTKQQAIINEISDLCTEIIQNNQNNQNDHSQEEENTRSKFVDFTDPDNLTKNLKVYKEVAVTNKLITGLQGMNRALGGYIKLGEAIVLNSLSHHAKSTLLLKMARWMVTLNKMNENFKNPTCLFYSLENEAPHNLLMLFNELYINIYKQVPPPDMSDKQIVNFCYDHFNKYGWKLIIDRRLGAEFGFAELVANFEDYVRNGYTPVVCIIDYMNMMKKGAVREDGSGNHLLIRDLYTNTVNYLKSKNCTLITAHQLNRKAAEVARLNPVGAVKKFNADMLADSMDPQREVDVVFYQHKEIDTTGRSFLTWKLDKHRYDTTTPDKDKYFAYMFDGPLGIMDDIDGEDKSTDNIYAVPHAKVEEELDSMEDAVTKNTDKVKLF